MVRPWRSGIEFETLFGLRRKWCHGVLRSQRRVSLPTLSLYITTADIQLIPVDKIWNYSKLYKLFRLIKSDSLTPQISITLATLILPWDPESSLIQQLWN